LVRSQLAHSCRRRLGRDGQSRSRVKLVRPRPHSGTTPLPSKTRAEWQPQVERRRPRLGSGTGRADLPVDCCFRRQFVLPFSASAAYAAFSGARRNPICLFASAACWACVFWTGSESEPLAGGLLGFKGRRKAPRVSTEGLIDLGLTPTHPPWCEGRAGEGRRFASCRVTGGSDLPQIVRHSECLEYPTTSGGVAISPRPVKSNKQRASGTW
jgi:hypothetical protein